MLFRKATKIHRDGESFFSNVRTGAIKSQTEVSLDFCLFHLQNMFVQSLLFIPRMVPKQPDSRARRDTGCDDPNHE